MTQARTIGLAFPSGLTREAYRHILLDRGFAIVAADRSLAGVKAGADGADPDIILADAVVQGTLTETCRTAGATFPASRLVIAAPDLSIDEIVQAFQEGAHGIVLSNMSCAQLASALTLVGLGERAVPAKVADHLTSLHRAGCLMKASLDSSQVSLSNREVDILKYLMAGDANKIIARHLSITEATVKVHVKAILRKIQVENRTQAAIWATFNGMRQSADMRPDFADAPVVRQAVGMR